MPTEFGRPFRSFGGWNDDAGHRPLCSHAEIDCTLLRSDPRPVRTARCSSLTRPCRPTIGRYNDPNGNPFFRYQAIQRLGNLVTTRSNVYAVWITVGYFEVDADGTTAVTA